MSIITGQLAYALPNQDILFRHINLSVPTGQKAALIGNNGTGKSTLLQLLAGEKKPSEGEIILSGKHYFVPQHFGQYNQMTIAEALQIDETYQALQAILRGDASEANFTLLNHDWEIEERSRKALDKWGLTRFALSHPMASLSGGEKTKVFLAGIDIHAPEIILLDEPTNHLDSDSREQLYAFIRRSSATLLVVSHDRTLLNLLPVMHELTPTGIESYGGNYDFYKEEREKKLIALQNQLEDTEKELRKARKTAREAMERQQKHDVRGEKQNLKKGVPRIVMGNLKSQAEKSTAKLKGIHEDKLENLAGSLAEIRKSMPTEKDLKLNFSNAQGHKGKILIEAQDVNFGYGDGFLWTEDRNLIIRSGERIALQGQNGSGKTTLIKLFLGQIEPRKGSMKREDFRYLYLDQEYSLIDDRLSVFEQLEQHNHNHLLEHELKIVLHRFLFPQESWDKPCIALSGGEKMRLLLACLQVSNQVPDVFILDEPTNNLDINSLEILTATLRDYRGTLIVISHDRYFLDEIGVEQRIEM